MNEVRWVSTNESLPKIGDKVLIITKFGHISDAILKDYGIGGLAFSPSYFKPNEDAKWWAPIPTDGWHDIREVKPKEGQAALTMGSYGKIFSGVWGRPSFSEEYYFQPFVWEVLFWREIPELPRGVTLK